MMEPIANLGCWGIKLGGRIGRSGLFLISILCCKPKFKRLIPMIIEQIYVVGTLSLLIITVSGLFMGMVLALQGYSILQRFGAVEQLGQLVALSVLRELGPVVGSLLFAGRAGSALTAEIGLMQATEQLSSMEMMAVDPLWRIIAPRFWAGIIAMPILIAIFCIVAIFGSYLIGVEWLGVDAGQFWSNMQAAVNFRIDILNGIIKGIIFGMIITWIAVYQGYYTTPTAAGIGQATTRTVVHGSLMILGVDFILTSFMLGGW